MKMLDIVNALRLNGMQVFRVNDVARLTGKPKAYVYLQLSKSRMVSRAQNGIYYLNDADPMAVASSITSPSYISLISAFSYYKMIDQVPNEIKVLTTKRHRPVQNVHNFGIEFRTVKVELMYGYSNRRGVVVADIEKAIVDSLYLSEDTKYIGEVMENAAGDLDSLKLLDYASRSGVSVIAAKVKRLLKGV
jgi:predicted transcriptional regulator of viral defense system